VSSKTVGKPVQATGVASSDYRVASKFLEDVPVDTENLSAGMKCCNLPKVSCKWERRIGNGAQKRRKIVRQHNKPLFLYILS